MDIFTYYLFIYIKTEYGNVFFYYFNIMINFRRKPKNLKAPGYPYSMPYPSVSMEALRAG